MVFMVKVCLGSGCGYGEGLVWLGRSYSEGLVWFRSEFGYCEGLVCLRSSVIMTQLPVLTSLLRACLWVL